MVKIANIFQTFHHLDIYTENKLLLRIFYLPPAGKHYCNIEINALYLPPAILFRRKVMAVRRPAWASQMLAESLWSCWVDWLWPVSRHVWNISGQTARRTEPRRWGWAGGGRENHYEKLVLFYYFSFRIQISRGTSVLNVLWIINNNFLLIFNEIFLTNRSKKEN